MENKKIFKDVNNYTKYKLVQMLIDKYKDRMRLINVPQSMIE